MRPGSRAWTEDEIELLTQMRNRGMSAKEMAAILGRSEASVTSQTSNIVSRPEVIPEAAPTARKCATRAEFVTASLMGDPASGRSALDQRRQ